MTTKDAIESLQGFKNYCMQENPVFGVTTAAQAFDFAIAAMKDLEVCRNELCLRCGAYKQRHLGACDGCRWKEERA